MVVGDGEAGPIIPPGIISPGFIWPLGAGIAPGFIICSPFFISSQHAIFAGLLCPSDEPPSKPQLRKNPERKTAATINKLPATMPTHASAW
jgi:hypothetical protein